MQSAEVSVIVPSYNQGDFLDQALSSVFSQNIAVNVHVLDGGSSDNSLQVIKRWESRISSWRSGPDGGQSAAINEGMKLATTPFVCWLNSDDFFMPGGLEHLVATLQSSDAPAVYGRTWDKTQSDGQCRETWVQPFSRNRLAQRCIISQPGTLIRRSVWEAVGGLDESLHMALDYDLWWRIFKMFGPMMFTRHFVAVNRIHKQTKTTRNRRAHYREAMRVVRRHHGRIPIKWWLAQPYQVWFRSNFTEL